MRLARVRLLLSLWTMVSLVCLSLLPQSAGAQNSIPAQNENGVHPEETYDGVRENINLATGNVFLSIPLLTLAGRNGLDYSVTMTYNSQIWEPTLNNGQQISWVWGGSQAWHTTQTGYITFAPSGYVALSSPSNVMCLENYSISFWDGSSYSIPGLQTGCDFTLPNGGGPDPNNPAPQYDVLTGSDSRGEGINVDLTAANCRITLVKTGRWYPLSGCPTAGGWMGVFEDRNGNQITNFAQTDTVGRTITVGNGHVQYNDSNGVARAVTSNWSNISGTCPLSGLSSSPGGAARNLPPSFCRMD